MKVRIRITYNIPIIKKSKRLKTKIIKSELNYDSQCKQKSIQINYKLIKSLPKL